jgi:hypothetical protein
MGPLRRHCRVVAGVVLEVRGFNDGLIRLPHDYRCARVVRIRPDDRKKRKTDRRDAAAPSELWWAGRNRRRRGNPVRGLRQMEIENNSDPTARPVTPTGHGCCGSELLRMVTLEVPPDSIARTNQTARRAGRGDGSSLGVMCPGFRSGDRPKRFGRRAPATGRNPLMDICYADRRPAESATTTD